ncbi:dephospho-CoA kinase [Capnocytophaga ochracea F0287]|uniref:Dephospho-CoA kinase n=1 Tax=Capnocytophaga ochracea F0287 TaxID=873517 RepID=E4MV88_CAPOC|nr:dephospho-CoA kinase [Capnocytophaga ochracea]EFS96382.1 dephospho-CoA kinase [Capnocytophaga ochracea F0287]EJF44638.1 dephospho-CoA kinase [Capnocytophaga ochracea str. Holt 25]UEB43041.1 dephospho-CoA kinase [Capnocytophaga ochracea]
MMVVGLTGGIGSGKSTIAKEFAALGIAVFNSDEQAKVLIATDAQVKERIIAAFGEKAYQNGEYNRAYIAQIVFNNPEKLAILNSIVHPALAKHFKQWAKKQTSPYVLKEAAILFENGSYKDCDYIITVTAPEQLRIARVMARDHCTEAQVRARMAQQWSDAQRIALSNAVIENIDLESAKEQVKRIHLQLCQSLKLW